MDKINLNFNYIDLYSYKQTFDQMQYQLACISHSRVFLFNYGKYYTLNNKMTIKYYGTN